MANPVWITGPSHGVAALSVNGGGLASYVSNAPTVQSLVTHNNPFAYRFNSAGTTCYMRKAIGTPTVLSGVLWFRFDTLWSASTQIMQAQVTAGIAPQLRYNRSAGQFSLYNGSTYVNMLAADTLVWHRFDFVFDCSGDVTTLQGQIDGGAEFTHSITQAATTFSNINLGANVAGTGDLFIAEGIFYDTNEYPIGNSGVERLSPAADGTHSAGTVMKNTGGTVVDGTVGKTAYTEVDDATLDSTADYVQQTGTGAYYAEVTFADTAQTTILGAAALLAYMSAGTSSNGAGCTIIDEDATETAVWGKTGALADYSESSLFYKQVVLPVPAAGWDAAAVNALKGRMGFGASDVNPVPYWEGLIIEVAYTVGGGTVNPMSLAGALTPPGTLTRQAKKPLSGGLTPSGFVAKQAKKPLAGALTPAGALSRRFQTTLSGATTPAGALVRRVLSALAGGLTPAGALSYRKAVLRAFAGALAPTGSLIRQAGKLLGGSLTPSGSLARTIQKLLAGATAPAGALSYVKAVLRAFAGSLAPAGAWPGRKVQKALAGALTPTGAIVLQIRRALAGALTPAGSLTYIKAVLRAFAGATTPAGSLSRQAKKPLSGGLAPPGTLSKMGQKTLAGSLSPSGTLAYLKAVLRAFAGSLSPSGTITRQARKTLDGGLTLAGSLSRTLSRRLVGSLTPAGAHVRQAAKGLSGSLSPEGTLTRQAGKPLVGSLAPAGLLVKTIQVTITGALTAAGSLGKRILSLFSRGRLRIAAGLSTNLAVESGLVNGLAVAERLVNDLATSYTAGTILVTAHVRIGLATGSEA